MNKELSNSLPLPREKPQANDEDLQHSAVMKKEENLIDSTTKGGFRNKSNVSNKNPPSAGGSVKKGKEEGVANLVLNNEIACCKSIASDSENDEDSHNSKIFEKSGEESHEEDNMDVVTFKSR